MQDTLYITVKDMIGEAQLKGARAYRNKDMRGYLRAKLTIRLLEKQLNAIMGKH